MSRFEYRGPLPPDAIKVQGPHGEIPVQCPRCGEFLCGIDFRGRFSLCKRCRATVDIEKAYFEMLRKYGEARRYIPPPEHERRWKSEYEGHWEESARHFEISPMDLEKPMSGTEAAAKLSEDARERMKRDLEQTKRTYTIGHCGSCGGPYEMRVPEITLCQTCLKAQEERMNKKRAACSFYDEVNGFLNGRLGLGKSKDSSEDH